MARSRKVMKVKRRTGTERKGCNSIAANKKTQHVLKEKEEQTALSANESCGSDEGLSFLRMPNLRGPSNGMAENTVMSI